MAEMSEAQRAVNEDRRRAARQQRINVLRDHVTESETRLRNARRARENGDALFGAKVPKLAAQLEEDRRNLAEAEAALADLNAPANPRKRPSIS